MGYIIPALLAVTIALLLLLSLSSVAIWRHYQVSNIRCGASWSQALNECFSDTLNARYAIMATQDKL